MKILPTRVLIPGLVAAVSLAAGFGPAQAQDKELTLAWSLPALQFPFFVHMQKALRDEAGEIGGITLIETDGQNQTTKQTADVEAAVTQGVDGIIISPLDAVAMAPARPGGGRCRHPGRHHRPPGRRRARDPGPRRRRQRARRRGAGQADHGAASRTAPPSSTCRAQPGASPAIDRNKGAHNVLDAVADKYKFVAEQTAHFQRDEAVTVTESILAGLASPPDVILAANDDMALGALQVVKEQGLADQGHRLRCAARGTRRRSATAG